MVMLLFYIKFFCPTIDKNAELYGLFLFFVLFLFRGENMNSFEEKVFGGSPGDCELLYCGKRIGNFGHTYGPHTRDDHLIYYIKEGRARLLLGDREHELSGGSIFVNFPHGNARYAAYPGEPWSIKWISAKGPGLDAYLSLVGLTREMPYRRLSACTDTEWIFDEMYDRFDGEAIASRFFCLSLLHRLFSLLAGDTASPVDSRIARARALIAAHYAEPDFGVARLADMLGFHHNYFSVLYKKETGETPVRTITEHRLRAAAKMLRFTDRAVKEIAYASGFLDELYFSRAFRARYGLPPTAYRRSHTYPI